MTEAGLNALLDLDIDGSVEMAVVKEIQRHPVRREVTHIDFLRVDPDARIDVEIPIHTTGEAALVTQEEGIAELRLTSLHVSVKPTDIPEGIVVDISEMTLDRTITVADLELPANVDVVTPADQVVVSAELTRAALVEEEPVEDEEAEEAEGEEAAEDVESSDAGVSPLGDLLVVGLGNPGDRYTGTRHNVGADAVELLASRDRSRLRADRRVSSSVADVRVGETRVHLAVPTTFMNDSGARCPNWCAGTVPSTGSVSWWCTTSWISSPASSR